MTFGTCAIEHSSFRLTCPVVQARVAQTRNIVNCNDKGVHRYNYLGQIAISRPKMEWYYCFLYKEQLISHLKKHIIVVMLLRR